MMPSSTLSIALPTISLSLPVSEYALTYRTIRGSEQSLIYAINNMGELVSAQVDTVDGYVLTERTITADKIMVHSITANELAAHTITANEILAGTITGEEIAAATIEGANVKAGTLTTNHVAADFGESLDLSSNQSVAISVEKALSGMEVGAVSQPTVSASSVNMGSTVTIYTNRQSSATTHTISYWFGNSSGAIATNVGASVSWTPPLSLASQIPNATSGICTITCSSFVNGTITGTRTCTFTLNVPTSVVPSISSVTVEDTNTTVKDKIAAFVKSLSTLQVAITAAGVYGSSISSYRTSLDGVTYTAASFTASKKLSAAGDMIMTVTVTDSRGRTATYQTTFNVLDYAVPSIK